MSSTLDIRKELCYTDTAVKERGEVTMRCEICDREIPEGAKECPFCGFEVEWMSDERDFISSIDERYDVNEGYRYEPILRATDDINSMSIPQLKTRRPIMPILIALVTGIIIACVGFLVFFQITGSDSMLKSPQNKKEGFVGIDGTLTMETSASSILDLQVENQTARKSENIYYYHNIHLFEKYEGSLHITANTQDKEVIETMCFHFQGDVNCAEVIADISELLGEPVHSENYNDQRYEYAHFVWYTDNECYFLLDYNTQTGQTSLTHEKLDVSLTEERNQCLATIESIPELEEAYEAMKARVHYIGLTIEDVLNDVAGVEFDNTTPSSVTFVEQSELFGFSGHYKYWVDNPKGDYYDSEFLGQVYQVTFAFDNLSETEKESALSCIQQIYGENDFPYGHALKTAYAACETYGKEENLSLSLVQGAEYYLYEPMSNSVTSTENIPASTDCDSSILHLYETDYNLEVSMYSDSGEICWELTMEAVKNRLKSPSSADFPTSYSDIQITRDGDDYTVVSWVDAQNSFGAQVRTTFKVSIRRFGAYFTVEDVFFY